jgi:putative molybdopterin biosynthesis protein
MPEHFYTVQEVADLFKIKKSTVYQMVKDGRLKAINLGRDYRFTQEEIERFIQQQTVDNTEKIEE